MVGVFKSSPTCVDIRIKSVCSISTMGLWKLSAMFPEETMVLVDLNYGKILPLEQMFLWVLCGVKNLGLCQYSLLLCLPHDLVRSLRDDVHPPQQHRLSRQLQRLGPNGHPSLYWSPQCPNCLISSNYRGLNQFLGLPYSRDSKNVDLPWSFLKCIQYFGYFQALNLSWWSLSPARFRAFDVHCSKDYFMAIQICLRKKLTALRFPHPLLQLQHLFQDGAGHWRLTYL